MMLDIFITHYNEPWEVGKKAFDMLGLQRCVDWSQIRVTLVHDGVEPFPYSYFEGYPFTVNQVSIPHSGIAGARNWCIDNSTAEWIRWCDFDDMFSGVYALRTITESLEHAENYDMLWHDVFMELHGARYKKTDRDPVVVHGKLFRRKFIQDHGLRFNEDLTWCEDSAFLAVLEMEIDNHRIGKITTESPIYVWIHREGSLCNRPEIRYSNLQSFFRRHCYVADEFLKRGLMDPYYTMIGRIMCDSYYTLRVAGLAEDTSDHERRVWEYFKAHRDDFLKCRKKAFDAVIEATNKENENCNITRDQVVSWLKELRLKYEKEV